MAGVSAGTVSRALANSELISPKTRDKIQALAKKHDFRPNIMARNLRIQKTGAIGVVIPLGHEAGQHVSDPFFMTMLGLLADGLSARGYDLMLSKVIPQDENWLDRIVDSGRVDGVILIGQSDQSAIIDRVAERYMPLVAWGGNRPGQVHCSVGTDNVAGGDMATSHLINRRCERIAFFGDPNAIEIEQRLAGCKAAMERAGLGDKLTVVPTNLIADVAHPEIKKFLSVDRQLHGIVAASDVIAMSALRVLSEMRVGVPTEMKVIGYDDLYFTQHTIPQLSSIRQDVDAGAAALIDLLFRRMAGEKTDSVVLPPELVVRLSS